MPHREPEPWESGAASPFRWIETAQGNVEVWALGEDRFRITAPGVHEQLVTGYDEAGAGGGCAGGAARVGGRKARGPTPRPSCVGPLTRRGPIGELPSWAAS